MRGQAGGAAVQVLSAARSQAGGAAVQVLGAALMLLLLVVGLGLADAVRAATLRTQAARALTAATDSAAREDLADHRAVERPSSECSQRTWGRRPARHPLP